MMSSRGETRLNLRRSILRKAAWQSCPAVCKFGIGRTKKATSAARQKFLRKTSILATARRTTTVVLPVHLRRASVRLRRRAALRPTLAAHSPAALCRTLVEAIKTIRSSRKKCFCQNKNEGTQYNAAFPFSYISEEALYERAHCDRLFYG